MIDYKEQYLKLFAAAADALAELERLNIGWAKEILLQAQLAAEEVHMNEPPAGQTCDFLKKL